MGYVGRYRRVVLVEQFSAAHQINCTPAELHCVQMLAAIVVHLPSPIHHAAAAPPNGTHWPPRKKEKERERERNLWTMAILVVHPAAYQHSGNAMEQRIAPSVTLHSENHHYYYHKKKANFPSDCYGTIADVRSAAIVACPRWPEQSDATPPPP